VNLIPLEKVKAILFLDIDGVLNQHTYDLISGCTTIRPHLMDRINWVLDATGAHIVLSSAWRYHVYRKEMTVVGMEWLLRSHGLMKDRFIGITKPDPKPGPMQPFSKEPGDQPDDTDRGQQILDWVLENDLKGRGIRYAVIDDNDLKITKHGHPFIQTNSTFGIQWGNAHELAKLLREVKDA